MRNVIASRPLILLFLFVALAGCSKDQRQRVLLTNLILLDEARADFETWDEQRQAQIVAQATSLEEGKAKLAEYRAQRDGWIALFKEAWKLLKAAAKSDDATSLGDAVKQVQKLLTTIHHVKGGS